MRVKNHKKRVPARGASEQPCLDAVVPAAAEPSFRAALSNFTQAGSHRGFWAGAASDARRAKKMRLQDICSSAVASAWAFLHAKYKISTTKRLRVSETISLGEKRFVAIVSVEGREFLIGGGASGMSLLAPLGPAAGGVQDLGQKISGSGGAL